MEIRWMCIYALRSNRAVIRTPAIDSKRGKFFHIEYHGNGLLVPDLSVLGCDAPLFGKCLSRFRSTMVPSFAYV
jgi:hypothetical protein